MLRILGVVGISEQDYRINEDYLWANYVDPAFIPLMLLIMLRNAFHEIWTFQISRITFILYML